MAFASDDRPPIKAPVTETEPNYKMGDGRSANAITEEWPKNEYGLTFGEPTRADADAMNLPDLTPMSADNGKEGFVRARELIYTVPKTAEEAAAQTRSRINDRGEDIRSVYGPDGKTVLGTVLISTVLFGK